MKVLSRLLLLAMLVASLGLVGCDGDDGDDGAAGAAGAAGASAYQTAVANGFIGTEAEWLASLQAPVPPASNVPPLETCYMCHDGAIPSADVATAHAQPAGGTAELAVSAVTVTPIGGPPATGVTVTFNVTKNGVADGSLTNLFRVYEYAASATPNATTGTAPNIYPVVNDFNRVDVVASSALAIVGGTYTVTINDAPPAGNATYLVTVAQATDETLPAVTAVGFLNGQPRDLVDDQACINCHGDYVFREPNDDTTEWGHHGANPYGVEACVVCHTRWNSAQRGAGGARLTAYVHGIHNSHNMPGGGYDRTFPVPTPKVNDFEVTYPTYMNNCSVCHSTPAQLAAVNAAPVTYSLCMSCHDGWAGFGDGTGIFGGINHNNYTWTGNCAACHDGGIAPATVAAFHNGQRTERGGLLWDGQDLAVVEGAKVATTIGTITRSGDNINVEWTATYNGAPVNPCNTTVGAAAPVFFGVTANTATGQSNSNMSFLKGFGQGDDWVNDGAATSPGQANAVNLATTNTTCSGNTATSVIPLTAAELASSKNGRGIVALQGKAQVALGFDFDPATAGTQNVIQVRSKTATKEYVVATGAAPATARRTITDTSACLKCHVGSLYQHGGNRIDNVEMCVICHNEASSEQNVRTGDGVDATEAYDGQAGQTYGFKSLLHAVHSTGSDVNPSKITMIYRTMGIYVWAPEGVTPPNWPGTGAQTVYGSTPAGTNTAGTTRTHNLHSPTYPRALNECDACHDATFAMVPDQGESVATTINTGASFNGQLDDTLEGTGAAACMSCHQQLKAHAYQNGWYPAVFPNGRQTILDAAQ